MTAYVADASDESSGFFGGLLPPRSAALGARFFFGCNSAYSAWSSVVCNRNTDGHGVTLVVKLWRNSRACSGFFMGGKTEGPKIQAEDRELGSPLPTS